MIFEKGLWNVVFIKDVVEWRAQNTNSEFTLFKEEWKTLQKKLYLTLHFYQTN